MKDNSGSCGQYDVFHVSLTQAANNPRYLDNQIFPVYAWMVLRWQTSLSIQMPREWNRFRTVLSHPTGCNTDYVWITWPQASTRNLISVVECYTEVAPLLTHCGYYSFALSHRFNHRTVSQDKWDDRTWNVVASQFSRARDFDGLTQMLVYRYGFKWIITIIITIIIIIIII